jgi:hypothetical protein
MSGRLALGWIWDAHTAENHRCELQIESLKQLSDFAIDSIK